MNCLLKWLSLFNSLSRHTSRMLKSGSIEENLAICVISVRINYNANLTDSAIEVVGLPMIFESCFELSYKSPLDTLTSQLAIA